MNANDLSIYDAGQVLVSGDFDDSAIDLSFTETGYVLDNSTVSGGLGDVSVSVDSGKTARLNAIVTSSYLTKTGYGVMIIEDDINFDTLVVEDGEAELQGEHDVVDRLTVESGAELCITGEVGLDNGAYFENGGMVEVDGGELSLAGAGHEGYVVFNNSYFDIFNQGQVLVSGSFLNDGGSVQPHLDGLFHLFSGGQLHNNATTYMGVYGSPEDGGKLQIDSGATVYNQGTMYAYSGGEVQLDGSLSIAHTGSFTAYYESFVTIGEYGYLGVAGGAINVQWGTEFTNNGSIGVYAAESVGGKFNIGAGNYGDFDTWVTNNGTFDAYGGGVEITLEGNLADGDGIATLENSGNLTIRDGAALFIKSNGELINNENSTMSIYSGDSDSEVTVEEGALFTNNGILTMYAGGKLSLGGGEDEEDATLWNGGNIVIDTGAEIEMNEHAMASNVGEANITINGEMAVNGGAAFENIGEVAIAAYSTLTIGNDNGDAIFNNDCLLTNNGHLVMGDGGILKNRATLDWESDNWSDVDKVDNYDGTLQSGNVQITHLKEGSLVDDFTPSIVMSGSLYNGASSPATGYFSLDSANSNDDDQGEWNSSDEFTLTYDPTTDTMTFEYDNVLLTRDDVTWEESGGRDLMFITAGMTGQDGENTGVRFSNLRLTCSENDPIGLGADNVEEEEAAAEDTLRIEGSNLRSGFTVTGTLLFDWSVASETENAYFEILAGTTATRMIELTMDGVDPSNWLDGGIVMINADNDNGSTLNKGVPETRDLDTSCLPKDDEELKKVSVTTKGTHAGDIVHISVSCVAGESPGLAVLWQDPRKMNIWGDVELTEDNQTLVVYVEGTEVSSVRAALQLNANIIDPNTSSPYADASSNPVQDSVLFAVGPVLHDLYMTKVNSTAPTQKGKLITTKNPVGVVMAAEASVDISSDGKLDFIQFVSNSNNIQQGMIVVGAVMGTANGPRYFSQDFLDRNSVHLDADPGEIYYGISAGHYTGDRMRVQAKDSPATVIRPLITPSSGYITGIDLSFNFTTYGVWHFSDGSFYTLGVTAWNVRFYGTINSAGDFTGGIHNAINVSTSFTRANANPSAPDLASTVANDAGADWYEL